MVQLIYLQVFFKWMFKQNFVAYRVSRHIYYWTNEESNEKLNVLNISVCFRNRGETPSNLKQLSICPFYRFKRGPLYGRIHNLFLAWLYCPPHVQWADVDAKRVQSSDWELWLQPDPVYNRGNMYTGIEVL